MNKVQQKQFEILKELDRLCRKNNIKYSLSGGTMLGAVRHKGFIPWDDDVDVHMIRKEYEKFKKVALKEMDEKFFYQDLETDPGYGNFYAKIRLNNTRYVENISKDVNAHKGIYIDIFPIDSYKKESVFDFYKVVFYRMLLLLKSNYIIEANTLVKKIELLILKFIKIFVTKKFVIKRVEKIKLNNSTKNPKNYINYDEVYFDKPLLTKNMIEKLAEYEFEGKKFFGPKDYEEYLTYFYGDYMQLPPENERENRHGIIEIEFDDAKENGKEKELEYIK